MYMYGLGINDIANEKILQAGRKHLTRRHSIQIIHPAIYLFRNERYYGGGKAIIDN